MGQPAKLSTSSDQQGARFVMDFFSMLRRAQKEFGLDFFLTERYGVGCSFLRIWYSNTIDEILNTTGSVEDLGFFGDYRRSYYSCISLKKCSETGHFDVFECLFS